MSQFHNFFLKKQCALVFISFFTICVYVSLGHTGNPLLVYMAVPWEKTKRQHFFLKLFHIFQPLIITLPKVSLQRFFFKVLSLQKNSHWLNLNFLLKIEWKEPDPYWRVSLNFVIILENIFPPHFIQEKTYSWISAEIK